MKEKKNFFKKILNYFIELGFEENSNDDNPNMVMLLLNMYSSLAFIFGLMCMYYKYYDNVDTILKRDIIISSIGLIGMIIISILDRKYIYMSLMIVSICLFVSGIIVPMMFFFSFLLCCLGGFGTIFFFKKYIKK